ncbi:DUF7033 domain-containing protein [Hymenobacter terrenus]|uniref:DUF7033 domain-containing protein n=1 Tax=Hymenobacter terrenus TaxID=1629124 RepID=UPI0006198909|nr:hypothetical protein [Hymenobacter terrenus]
MAASFSAELLPSPATIAVTPAVRLAYVLQHFRLAYEQVPPVEIGYGPAATVTVAEGAGRFFADATPYPAAPNWREWQGQRLPFFFDNSPEQELLTLTPRTARINVDVVAAAFYLLSGWQEYFSDTRDRHGRFPYAVSVQQQYQFVTLPIVNYYFEVLKTAIEHVTSQPLRPRRWNGTAPFVGFITHDIDNLHGGWGTAARYLLRRGRLGGLAKLLAGKAIGGPAPWNNLEQVQQATAQFGAPSTFFILGNNHPALNGTPNADYAPDTAQFRARLGRLAAQGAEIASHGSYGTADNVEKLQEEIRRFEPASVLGNRFHYLCWEPRRTPSVVAAAGVAYDSTLGFAEHFGFRNSYCLPFFPFDFTSGRAHSFLEIPLNVMDATLHHPNYLQLMPKDILPALRPMLAEIERFGGVATVLWHNENFDPVNTINGPHQFAELMDYLQQRGAAFRTGSQIVAELCQLVNA